MKAAIKVKVIEGDEPRRKKKKDPTMTIEEIASKLEAAGCDIKVWEGSRESRVYVRRTPRGPVAGYCVAADDIRDITEHVTKRQGDVRQILRS